MFTSMNWLCVEDTGLLLVEVSQVQVSNCSSKPLRVGLRGPQGTRYASPYVLELEYMTCLLTSSKDLQRTSKHLAQP